MFISYYKLGVSYYNCRLILESGRQIKGLKINNKKLPKQIWYYKIMVIHLYRCNKPNNTNNMRKEIMKLIIKDKVSTKIDELKIDELIEEMSTNEFKEMILDEYFNLTTKSLDDVDVELNELISEVSNTIRLGGYRTK